MKIPHLLAVATSISLSVTALAQFPASTSAAKRVPHAARITQTEAMLPVPASAASTASDAASARPAAPKLSGATGKHHAPLTRRQHLARYRDRNSGAASSTAGDPYQYDGWSASSVYANPAPASP
ncbi:hypothetical protein [Burkholderia arboris]|uniref:hypothetical protein n=1 Tax=Burkholderia arboris TaxID=488730 RepID=UPI001CF1593D|nr:hypothetical protein [Burkholderia arboris]MCA8051854.1 hypothetical protein [Burkholderia arboris]